MLSKSHTTDKQGILFFVKYPKIGQVKSRLGKDLDPDFIKQLYQCFVTDLLNMLKKTKIPLIICYAPPQYKTHFKQWLGEDYVYIPQIGMDLGERLSNGFRDGFNLGFSHLLVIGSDSPDLDKRYIYDAFHHLTSHDVVIGPSSDGGYYLLALKTDSFLPHFFDSIHWSTSTVLSETIQKIKQKDRTIFMLPTWHDIDTFSDLQKYYHRNLQTPFKNSVTMKKLKTYYKQKNNQH